MIRNKEELEKHVARLDEVAESKEGYKDRFEFYKEVLGLQLEWREKSRAGQKTMDENEARTRITEGFSLVDRLGVEPDVAEAAVLFEELLKLAGKKANLSDETVAEIEKAREAVSDFTDFLLKYFREGVVEEDLEKILSDNGKELLVFLLQNTIKPFYQNHALAYQDMTYLEEWNKGYCPVCGGEPSISALEGEGGKRKLLCHRCGFEWPFRRVRCPFCENSDHDKLRYMFFEEEPGYRIDICESCRGYLKCIDTNVTQKDVLMEAEDLATPQMDLIAEKEGYIKKSMNILGLGK